MKAYKIWAGALSSLAVSQPGVLAQPLLDSTLRERSKRENVSHSIPAYHSFNIRFVEDREYPFLVVEAYFCSANNTKDERRILNAALDFWNRQSGKFGYKVRVGEEHKIIPVYFQLFEASGMYSENGFFLPAGRINASMLTYLEVVPDQRIGKLDKSISGGHAIGFAAPNTIYISEKYADNEAIGLHEMGHILGAKHVSFSVMDATINQVKPKVKKKTIRQILAKGGIPIKGRDQLSKFPRKMQVGNLAAGKIVRHHQKISKPFLVFSH